MGIGNIGSKIASRQPRGPHGPTTADGAERRAEDRRSNTPAPGAGLPRSADAAERWSENRNADKLERAGMKLKDGLTSAVERNGQSEAAESYSAIYS